MADARLIVVVVGAPEGAELAVEVGAFVAVLGTADEVHRVGPGLLADLQHLVADLVDRLIPADLLVFAVDQLHRVLQAPLAMRVLADRSALGALRSEGRSEERRGGKEGGRTGGSWG